MTYGTGMEGTFDVTIATLPALPRIGSDLFPPLADRRPLVRLFAFSLLLMLVANACNLFLYPLSIDAELGTFDYGPTYYIGSGRWALSLLAKFVVPHAAIPVVPLLIACMSLSLAYVITAYTWETKIGWPHYLAAPLALCYPTLFQILSFSIVSYAVGLAILFCAAALHLLSRPSPIRSAAAVMLFTFAFGIYQPVALFPCAALMVGLGYGLACRGFRRTLSDALIFIACATFAAIANRAIEDLSFAYFQFQNYYTDSYYDLSYFWQHPLRTIAETLTFAAPVLFGFGGPFITDQPVYTISIACAGALTLAHFARSQRDLLRVAVSVGLIFGAVLCSILPPLITRAELPFRVFLGTPIALAGVMFCAGQIRLRPARALLGLLVAASFLGFAEIGARLTYSSYMVWLNDRALGEAILARIDALDDLPPQSTVPIEFVGFHDWVKSEQIIDMYSSTMGTSFFAWDQGNPKRIIAFLKTLGRFDLAQVAPEKRAAMRPQVDTMPVWPRPGSVAVVDGTVVVRFGPYTDTQLKTLFPKTPSP